MPYRDNFCPVREPNAQPKLGGVDEVILSEIWLCRNIAFVLILAFCGLLPASILNGDNGLTTLLLVYSIALTIVLFIYRWLYTGIQVIATVEAFKRDRTIPYSR